ncbi:MAG: DUF6314 family protein [Candidatus Latescibacterota bacterium]|nr:DUF6314 family protein [Candidatus Latescibacterota bacterium]
MFPENRSLQTFFHNLAHVHTVQSESKSLLKTGWNGKGSGKVSTAWHDKQTLVFTEQGSWQSANGNNFNFSNIYRWTLEKNSISVAHLRQGPNHPVFLVELIPDGNILRSKDPHICKRDKYSAMLTMAHTNLSLVWNVVGPSKNEHMVYLYTTEPSKHKRA